MKFTKEQLRRIIKEELGQVSEDVDKVDAKISHFKKIRLTAQENHERKHTKCKGCAGSKG